MGVHGYEWHGTAWSFLQWGKIVSTPHQNDINGGNLTMSPVSPCPLAPSLCFPPLGSRVCSSHWMACPLLAPKRFTSPFCHTDGAHAGRHIRGRLTHVHAAPSVQHTPRHATPRQRQRHSLTFQRCVFCC